MPNDASKSNNKGEPSGSSQLGCGKAKATQPDQVFLDSLSHKPLKSVERLREAFILKLRITRKHNTPGVELEQVAANAKSNQQSATLNPALTPTNLEFRAVGLAAVAALLSLGMDQEPDVLLADANELINSARDFLLGTADVLDAQDKCLTLSEAIAALGYMDERGLWKAVERALGKAELHRLKHTSKFDLKTLETVVRHIQKGIDSRTTKARRHRSTNSSA